MSRTRAILLALMVAIPAVAWAATEATTKLDMAGGPVHLSINGTTVVVEGVDSAGNAAKRSAVISCVVSGQPVVLLLRLQRAGNGEFIDILADNTVGNVDTLLGSLDLSDTVVGHPAPASDSVDDSAITAAGG